MNTQIYSFQTGVVHVKADFLKGSVEAGGMLRFFGKLLTDKTWVDLPIYAWAVVHSEGVIVIDTGDRADTTNNFVSQSTYTILPEEEISAQLLKLGIKTSDVSKIVLTHIHGDHANGINQFPNTPVFLGEREYAFHKSAFGGRFNRFATRIPNWFDPQPLVFRPEPVGTFESSIALTKAGDVIAVSTPGHTAGHISIIVIADNVHYLIAGDVTYNEQGLLDQKRQGPSLAPAEHTQTLDRILRYAQQTPLVYLPSHDWESANRLATKQTVTTNFDLSVKAGTE
jgi:glyoxylase-like metal-dependent hydrolase (beta-lactamase superfamily II)